MRKTKIVCTLGPASRSQKTINELVQAGMNVARLNFSHDTKEEHRKTMKKVREASEKNSEPVAILQDLAGPKIRIGKIENAPVTLKPNQEYTLTSRDIIGNDKEVSLTHKHLPKDVKEGDHILLADGSLELEVIESDDTDIKCKVIIGGKLSSKKGVNLPDTAISTKTLTDKDREDLKFGLENCVDYVALSFVRSAKDIQEVKDVINGAGRQTKVIAKIEKNEALKNIKEIFEVVDGIMIARGDLGVETPIEDIPVLQKELARKAKKKGKLVITATQMLKSMENNPRPTRAEVTDVSNAIFDGTDAIMLSEETAIGKYPVKTVEVMGKIAKSTEKTFPYDSWTHQYDAKNLRTDEAIAKSACEMADLVGACGIINFTHSGHTSKLVSKYKPSQKIIALTPSIKTYNQLSLAWGVTPIHMKQVDTVKKIDEQSTRTVVEKGVVEPGKKLIITAGLPLYKSGTTNLLEVAKSEGE